MFSADQTNSENPKVMNANMKSQSLWVLKGGAVEVVHYPLRGSGSSEAFTIHHLMRKLRFLELVPKLVCSPSFRISIFSQSLQIRANAKTLHYMAIIL